MKDKTIYMRIPGEIEMYLNQKAKEYYTTKTQYIINLIVKEMKKEE